MHQDSTIVSGVKRQSIFRSNPSENFTKISNSVLQDEDISLEALGLLCRMLSRPQDWEITVACIRASGRIGRDKSYKLIRELETKGLAVAHQERKARGKFGNQCYAVSDDPQLLISMVAMEIHALQRLKPLPENTDTVVPFPRNQETGKTVAQQSRKPLPDLPLTVNTEAGSPFPDSPLTANQTQTNKRELQRKDIYMSVPAERDDYIMCPEVEPEFELQPEPLAPPAKPKRPRKRKAANYSDAFNAAWMAYPRSPTMSKIKAWENWERNGCEEIAETVIAAARAEAERCHREGVKPEFVKHMQGWITDRRWEGMAESAEKARVIAEEQQVKAIALGYATRNWEPAMSLWRTAAEIPERLKKLAKEYAAREFGYVAEAT